jgi:uncharacterized SAM-binding protein YcdF (DUF218 family)
MLINYTQPLYPFFLLLAFAGLVRAWLQANSKKPVLLAFGVTGLFLVTWPPVAWLLLQPFERAFPPGVDYSADAQAIVVLAGDIDYSSVPGMPSVGVGLDTLERCQYAAFLHKHWSALPVLATGGGSQVDSETPPYATLMKDALSREGVPASMIWTETKSRTTHENAEFSAELLREKGITKIILVTDAYHMTRAAKSFRKMGLTVVPAACGYRSFDEVHLYYLIPSWEALEYNEDVLHETVGLMWYRIRGWT